MNTQTHLIDAYQSGAQIAREAVAGMNREQLLSRPISGKWSTLEVLCHLADSDLAWTHRMKCVIAEEKPLLIGYDESRFAARLAYQERDALEELAILDQTRRQMARILRTLPTEAWSRLGVHSERGLISLEQQVKTMIEHIVHHVKFIQEKRKALGT